jgi:HAD superfamily hydrolase (TIGR01509 family)
MSAVVFDCDGVLADTERYGHLPAFNQAFQEFGLRLHWSEEDYRRKLEIAGGKERIVSELTPEFVRTYKLPPDPEGQAALVATWHRRKTQIYLDMVSQGKLPPRPGITRIIGEARAAGWKIGIASTSAEPSVRAILERAIGPEGSASVDALLAGDCVAHKKPAADIYLLALDKLAEDPENVLVIEDSVNGLQAARAAGLTCLITLNTYTQYADFSEAALVVSSLGDPGGEKTTVIANRSSGCPGDYLTLADLQACLQC